MARPTPRAKVAQNQQHQQNGWNHQDDRCHPAKSFAHLGKQTQRLVGEGGDGSGLEESARSENLALKTGEQTIITVCMYLCVSDTWTR